MSIRPLAPELACLAQKICGETPEKMQMALKEIKDWLEMNPYLHARADDQWLTFFIRAHKFKMEIVKKKLDSFYTCRHIASDYYQLHHNDNLFKELVDSGFYLPLPKLTGPAAPRVTLVRTGVVDMLQVGVVNIFAAVHIINKILQVDDDNGIIAGSHVLLDFKNINMFNMFQLSPVQMKMLRAKQRIEAHLIPINIFVINLPEGLEFIFNTMKNMFTDMLKSQIYIYNENYEEIYTRPGLSIDIMPAEYGGNGGTLQEITDHWKRKLEEYNGWLEEDLQFGTDESRRPGGPTTTENEFGAFQNKNLYDSQGLF